VGWFFVETDSRARVNVVFTSDDDTKNDKDGRQIEREIGVVHRDETPAKGGYWRHVDEKARATEWAD
jgi:hypothetical protein